MISYWKIFANAWVVTWRHKQLWLLGVLLAFLGNGAELGQAIRLLLLEEPGGALFNFWQGLWNGKFFTYASIEGITRLASSADAGALAGTLLLLGALLLLTLLLIGFSLVSLAMAVALIQSYAAGKSLTLRQAWHAAWRRLWALLLLSAAMRLTFVLAFLAVAAVAERIFLGRQLLLPMVAISGTVVGVAAGWVGRFAILSVVLEGKPLVAAVQRAVALVRRHWLATLEFSLLAFGLYWLVLVVVANSFLLLVLVISRATGQLLLTPPQLALWVGVVLGLAQIPLAVLLWSAWTLAFDVLISPQLRLRTLLGPWLRQR